jgi:pullulanase
VRKALDAIDPSIIVLGEGWDMNTTMDKSLMTIQANGTAVAPKDGDNGISFFNDSIRDGLKGSVFSDTATGFVSGDIDSADGSKKGKERLIANNLLACPTSDTANDTDLCNGGDANYGAPGQLVQYAEIHDNMTLYDKLLKSVPKQEGMSDDEYAADIVARAKLTDSAVMLAQGTTAIQLGQEFLRTKNGDGNSYKSGDGANAIDWNRSVEQADSVVYVRGLIALRKAIGSMHASSYEEIAKNMTITQQDNGVVAYQLTNGNDKYVVILNANDAAVGVSSNVVPSGEYTTLVAQGTVLALPASTKTKVMANSMEKTSTASRLTRSAQTDLDVVVGDGGYEAAGLSATVLKATTQGGSPVVPISPENPDQPDTGDGSDNGQTAGQDGNAAHGIADTGAPVVAVVVVALLLLASGCVISVTAKGRRS